MAHGKVQNKDLKVGCWGYKSKVGGARKSSTLQFHFGTMSSFLGSPSYIIPTADNVQMDVDSDLEAEQVAWEFAQTQEWLRIANEAWERCWEERK